MTTTVKLKVEITEKSSAEFDVVVTWNADRFEARIDDLALKSDGKSVKKALQEMVRQIQNNGAAPTAAPMIFG